MDMQKFATALGCTVMRAEPWLDAFIAAIAEHKVQNVAMFLAQVGHETAGLSHLEENLNYSAQRLTAVWPSRFLTLAAASVYANNPERLANMVYGGRMGNRDTLSGDGWRYRGRGPLQVTGANNYKRAGEATGLQLLQRPELLLEPAAGVTVAAWHFVTCGADTSDIDKSSDLVNLGRLTSRWGDAEGFQDRKVRFERALKALAP